MTKVFVIITALLYVVLPEVSAAGDRTNNGNGTVTDNKTHLMWQRGEGGEMNWDKAIAYCNKLTLAGYNDWRLPNMEELKSLLSVGKRPINKTDFPNAHYESYWSSTTDAGNRTKEGNAWSVDFNPDSYFAGGYYSVVWDWYYVRCVRGGQ